MFKKKDLTATSLGLRIVMGGYLLYLAYSLLPAIQKAPDAKEMIFWIAIVVLFFCVGVGALFFSIKALLKGEYEKGNQKIDDETEINEENNNVIEETDVDDTIVEDAMIEDINIEVTSDKEEK